MAVVYCEYGVVRAASQVFTTNVTASFLSGDGQSHQTAAHSSDVSLKEDTPIQSSQPSQPLSTAPATTDKTGSSVTESNAPDASSPSSNKASMPTFAEDATNNNGASTTWVSATRTPTTETPAATRPKSAHPNYYLISAIGLIAITLAVWFIRRRKSSSAQDSERTSPVQSRLFGLLHQRAAVVVSLMFITSVAAGWLVYHRVYRADTNTAATPTVGPDKRLIVMGDMPDYDALMANPTAAAKIPFDGAVIYESFFKNTLPSNKKNHTTENLQWIFSSAPMANVDVSYLQPWVERWQKVKDVKSLKHSLLGLWTAPGSLTSGVALVTDGDDVWNNISRKVTTVATVATQAGFDGLMIDTEPYVPKSIFSYPTTYNGQNLTDTYSCDPKMSDEDWQKFYTGTQPIRDMAVNRGKEVADALNAAATNHPFDVLFTLTPTTLVSKGMTIENGTSKTWCSGYPLMVQFFDGLVSEIGPNVHLYDGLEIGNRNGSPDAIQKYLKIIQDTAALMTNPADYLSKLKTSFGLWPYQLASSSWYFTKNGVRYTTSACADEPACQYYAKVSDGEQSQNSMTPATIQSYLTNMLSASDKYVWYYTQVAHPWGALSAGPPKPKSYAPFGNENFQALSLGKQAKTINNAPIWQKVPGRTVLAGQPITFDVPDSATDPDNDIIDTWIQSAPAGATFSDQYQEKLTWTPTTDQVGTQTITLAASDGLTTVTKNVTFDVQLSTPVVTVSMSSDKTSISKGETFSYSVHYANTGNDIAKEVTITIDLPSGLNVTAGQTTLKVGDLEAGKSGDITLTVTPT